MELRSLVPAVPTTAQNTVCRTVDNITPGLNVPGTLATPLVPSVIAPPSDGGAGMLSSTYVNCVINNVGPYNAGPSNGDRNCHVCGVPDTPKNIKNNYFNCVVNNMPSGFANNWGMAENVLNPTLNNAVVNGRTNTAMLAIEGSQRVVSTMMETGKWALTKFYQSAKWIKDKAVERVQRARAEALERAKEERARIVEEQRQAGMLALEGIQFVDDIFNQLVGDDVKAIVEPKPVENKGESLEKKEEDDEDEEDEDYIEDEEGWEAEEFDTINVDGVDYYITPQ